MIVQYHRNQIVRWNLNHLMIFLNNFIVCFNARIFREFIYVFFSLAISSNDRSTLSDDDEGISSDDLDDEDISRKAIHRALTV